MYPLVGWLGRYGSQALIINLDRETVCYWITRFRFTLWRRNRHGNRPFSHCFCTSPPRVDHPIHNNKTAALMSLHWLYFSPQIFVFFFLFYIRVCVCVCMCIHKEFSTICVSAKRHASPSSLASCCADSTLFSPLSLIKNVALSCIVRKIVRRGFLWNVNLYSRIFIQQYIPLWLLAIFLIALESYSSKMSYLSEGNTAQDHFYRLLRFRISCRLKNFLIR